MRDDEDMAQLVESIKERGVITQLRLGRKRTADTNLFQDTDESELVNLPDSIHFVVRSLI